MRTSRIRSRFAALTILAIGLASGLFETDAQAQMFRGRGQGGQYKVKVKERGYYRAPYVVSPFGTRAYIQAAPVTVTETQVYQPTTVTETQVYQPAPVVQQHVYQSAPYV